MLFSFSRAPILYGLHIPAWQTDAQNRQSGVRGKKKSLTTMALSPTPTYHLRSSLTFASPCVVYVANLRVTLSDACLLLAKAGENGGLKCRLLFSVSSSTHLCFIKSFSISCWFTEASFLWDHLRAADRRGSLRSHWTPRLAPRSYTIIPHCLPCQPHKLSFF